MIYVVIDTNVLVSALITKNPEAATAKVVRLLLSYLYTLKAFFQKNVQLFGV